MTDCPNLEPIHFNSGLSYDLTVFAEGSTRFATKRTQSHCSSGRGKAILLVLLQPDGLQQYYSVQTMWIPKAMKHHQGKNGIFRPKLRMLEQW